ncbi:MAG: tRNA (N6-isopentenyl adenosine(37)-C2)-methylthiotransferase MiaB [Lachnospiraceae bacterium]
MRQGKVNTEETKKQLKYMEQVKELLDREYAETGHRRTFCVTTFGCQMNAKDSEKLCGILEKMGFEQIDSEKADFVLYNTCTVRENANLKVYGHLGHLKKQKQQNPRKLIALCGCMMQEPTVIDKIKESYSFVDIIFGTHNIFKLAELVKNRMESDHMIIDIWDGTDEIVEDLPDDQKYTFKCGINIMYGCNNFCSYCIVPYVRGRERSRLPEDIIAEIKQRVAHGVVEVMLLGQNVNSYGKTLEHPITFAQLLEQIEQIDGLERIRFMTPHPKDLSEELIAVVAKSKKICHHIHLPLQSGSTRILKEMNRRYTKEQYLDLVSRIKTAIPDIALTTDIIVGFPGETEEDFLDTMDVVSKVKYAGAYTFIYSKRTGTPAATMENQVPEEVVKNRFDRLLALIHDITETNTLQDVGTVQPVLIEEMNSHDASMVTGKLSNNTTVHLKGDASLIGTIRNVKLTQANGFYYFGELCEENLNENN